MVKVARESEFEGGETGTETAVKMPIGNSECGRFSNFTQEFYRHWTPVSQQGPDPVPVIYILMAGGTRAGRPMIKHPHSKLCLHMTHAARVKSLPRHIPEIGSG